MILKEMPKLYIIAAILVWKLFIYTQRNFFFFYIQRHLHAQLQVHIRHK